MPSPLYDLFCAEVVSKILNQLTELRKSDEAFGDFTRKIKHLSISRIRLPNNTNSREQTYSERCPDTSFIHEHAKYPGVIIEVYYAEKVRAAADLAEDYILDTNASVNAMIALNIEYKGSKKAAIYVWRPHKITVDEVKELEAKTVIEMMVRSFPVAVLRNWHWPTICSLFERSLDFQSKNLNNRRCSFRSGTLPPRASHRNTPISI